jgi:hypothetical protein
MSIRTEVLAFRIWAFAHPRGWDCTLQELSDATGESFARISSVCQVKKWNGRLRSTSMQNFGLNGVAGTAREDEVATAAMVQLRAASPHSIMEKSE